MTFWPYAVALAALVALLMLLALLRRQADAQNDAQSSVEIYREQLRTIDRDVARGALGPEEAERVRREVSRRLLAADKEARQARTAAVVPRGVSLVAALALVALVLGGSAFLYSRLGAPAYPDLPLAKRLEIADQIYRNRPSQAEAEKRIGRQEPLPPPPDADPKYLELMERLRTVIRQNPDDLRGLKLLARNEAALGNFRAAYEAQSRIVEITGPEATANDHAELAELMILATNGYVSPEAEQQLRTALNRDPQHGLALYYSGLMFAQNERQDIAFRIWRQLLEKSPPDARWIPQIRAQIMEMAEIAGVNYQLPPQPGAGPGIAGPSREDIENAAGMSPEERQQMIRGMVGRLAETLATEGGPPEKWAQLIGAYGVLGETGRAAEIWAEARERFADQPEGLALIRTAARQAGVAE